VRIVGSPRGAAWLAGLAVSCGAFGTGGVSLVTNFKARTVVSYSVPTNSNGLPIPGSATTRSVGRVQPNYVVAAEILLLAGGVNGIGFTGMGFLRQLPVRRDSAYYRRLFATID
jgi:hypothetical protein